MNSNITDSRDHPNRAIVAWLVVGLLAYLALPWYAIQDANGLLQIPNVFSSSEAGNGVMQASTHGKPWLWLGMAGLLVAGASALMVPTRKQGALLMAGAGLGLLGLLSIIVRDSNVERLAGSNS